MWNRGPRPLGLYLLSPTDKKNGVVAPWEIKTKIDIYLFSDENKNTVGKHGPERLSIWSSGPISV